MMYKRLSLKEPSPKSAPEVTPVVHEHVWNASSVNLEGKFADPFFLRFVLDGVERRRIFLHRVETIPHSLDDAFEVLWLSLPDDMDFLCHRLLLTLGICGITVMMNCLQDCSIEMKLICQYKPHITGHCRATHKNRKNY